MNSLAVVAMGGAAAEAMHYSEVAASLSARCAIRLDTSLHIAHRIPVTCQQTCGSGLSHAVPTAKVLT